VSYDPVDVLAGFATKHGITYRLLSDVGSVAIRRLGLLNEHLAEQQAFYGVPVRDFHHGIPYPGVFMLDEQGIVVDKRFEQSYRHRPTAAAWAEEMAGTPPEAAVSAAAEGTGLRAVASLDAAAYRPYQLLRLRLDLEAAEGLHVYGEPVPDGYTPLTIEIAPFDGLAVRPATLPPPHPFRIEGLDEKFVVHEGRFTARVPFSVEGSPGDVTLVVTIGYQACGQTACFPPASLRLELPLAGRDLIRD
jgi:hypothetical protein